MALQRTRGLSAAQVLSSAGCPLAVQGLPSRRSPLNAVPLGGRRYASLVAALVFSVALPTGSIVTRHAQFPHRNTVIVFWDASYLFLYRHYGSATDPGGNTEAGFFVYSKAHDRWLQITSISTRGGRFGTSHPEDPAERQKLLSASVSWDFRGYAKVPFIDLPLRTSGSIAFPDKIEDDAERGRYRLRFMSSWGSASAETVLFVAKKDLVAAFGELFDASR